MLDREYAVCYSKKGETKYLIEFSFSRFMGLPHIHFHTDLRPILFTYKEACNMINLLYAFEYFPKSRKLEIEQVDPNA